MYKYLFGPVPSRRLGMSLGVDLVPRKICSLNCVYCEVGDTTKLTTDRMAYIPAKKIISELGQYFTSSPAPDYITFSGYGEPTLNASIGEIISFIKEKQPHIPVAVLTNGTLLFSEEVRKELFLADLVLPSLDAATEEAFQKINVPAPGVTIKNTINGLISFSKEFSGKIWLEVFILPGYNDSPPELTALKNAILQIAPDRVQLNTLDRPGRMENLQGASHDDLERVKDYWQLCNVEIIASAAVRKKQQAYRKDMENAILGTIDRRPCTADDLARILGTHVNEINKYLTILEKNQNIEHIRQKRGVFYQLKK